MDLLGRMRRVVRIMRITPSRPPASPISGFPREPCVADRGASWFAWTNPTVSSSLFSPSWSARPMLLSLAWLTVTRHGLGSNPFMVGHSSWAGTPQNGGHERPQSAKDDVAIQRGTREGYTTPRPPLAPRMGRGDDARVQGYESKVSTAACTSAFRGSPLNSKVHQTWKNLQNLASARPLFSSSRKWRCAF